MKRRDFLRKALATGMAAGAFALDHPLRPRLRTARAAVGKTLIVIFQRGGCDGLNTVVPYGDDAYYNLRPGIAIDPPNPNDSRSALYLDDLFGLHPALAPLAPIYDAGDLAIFPAVHYPNATRSHFDGQHFIESAASLDDRGRKGELDGWLNRYLSAFEPTAGLRAASFGSELAQSLRGPIEVSSFNDLRNFSLGLGGNAEQALLERLSGVYGATPSPDSAYRRLVHGSGAVAIDNLAVVAGLDIDNYQPANGAVYPNSGYGRQLRQIAQLIKEGVGLELATVNIGGWDNHNNQGGAEGSQARRFDDFSRGIAALYADLGGLMEDTLILSMTEFGRTAKENGSGGTDHGNASAWFALGGEYLRGGTIYGTWPGLAPSQLYRDRYLAFDIDYRNILGEVLTDFLEDPDLGVVFTGPAGDPGNPDSPAAYAPPGFIL